MTIISLSVPGVLSVADLLFLQQRVINIIEVTLRYWDGPQIEVGSARKSSLDYIFLNDHE
jgi:hypothetical protein